MTWQRADLVTPPANCLLHIVAGDEKRLLYGYRIKNEERLTDILYTSLFSDNWTHATTVTMKSIRRGYPKILWQIVDVPVELEEFYSIKDHTPTPTERRKK